MLAENVLLFGGGANSRDQGRLSASSARR